MESKEQSPFGGFAAWWAGLSKNAKALLIVVGVLGVVVLAKAHCNEEAQRSTEVRQHEHSPDADGYDPVRVLLEQARANAEQEAKNEKVRADEARRGLLDKVAYIIVNHESLTASMDDIDKTITEKNWTSARFGLEKLSPHFDPLVNIDITLTGEDSPEAQTGIQLFERLRNRYVALDKAVRTNPAANLAAARGLFDGKTLVNVAKINEHLDAIPGEAQETEEAVKLRLLIANVALEHRDMSQVTLQLGKVPSRFQKAGNVEQVRRQVSKLSREIENEQFARTVAEVRGALGGDLAALQ